MWQDLSTFELPLLYSFIHLKNIIFQKNKVHDLKQLSTAFQDQLLCSAEMLVNTRGSLLSAHDVEVCIDVYLWILFLFHALNILLVSTAISFYLFLHFFDWNMWLVSRKLQNCIQNLLYLTLQWKRL